MEENRSPLPWKMEVRHSGTDKTDREGYGRQYDTNKPKSPLLMKLLCIHLGNVLQSSHSSTLYSLLPQPNPLPALTCH